MRNFLIALALFACSSCTPTEDQINDTLTNMGFTDIEKGDAVLYGCARHEVGSHFRAKNPAGKPASGMVCCGFAVKGCTVRF